MDPRTTGTSCPLPQVSHSPAHKQASVPRCGSYTREHLESNLTDFGYKLQTYSCSTQKSQDTCFVMSGHSSFAPRIMVCVKRGGIMHYACHDITERHGAMWRHRRIGLSLEAIPLWHQCIMQWKVQRRLTPPSPMWTDYKPVLWVKSTW